MQPAPHLRDTSPACRERGARVGPALAGGQGSAGGVQDGLGQMEGGLVGADGLGGVLAHHAVGPAAEVPSEVAGAAAGEQAQGTEAAVTVTAAADAPVVKPKISGLASALRVTD